jgi:transmembrane sensor
MGTERTNEIDATASDWLIRRDSGAWTDADRARLDQWLHASALNRVAFLRLELAWEDAGRLKALGAGIQGDQPPPPGRWNLTPFFDSRLPDSPAAFKAEARDVGPSIVPAAEDGGEVMVPQEEAGDRVKVEAPRRGRRSFAVAAILLLTAGIAAFQALAPRDDRYGTAVGGFASVPMADGSNVTLNTDSQIRIALTETERRVELKRVGSKRVVAVGTKFSVRREGDDIEVVVTEGKVRVVDSATRQGSRGDGSSDVFLTPGSIARAGGAGVLVQRRTLPEAEEQLSWRNGVLMFRNQSLQEAVAEFNRYNDRKIVIQDPVLASLKIEGNFRATNIEAFVRLVESGFPVRAESQPNQIVLMSK